MMTHVKTVAVYVADQERALAFYTEILGFEVRRHEASGSRAGWIEVAPPGAQTSLMIYPRSMTPDWKQRKSVVTFHCEDVAAAFCELSARGVTFVDKPRQMDWGTFAMFVDFDGNEFVLTSEVQPNLHVIGGSQVSHPAVGPSPL